MPCTLHLLQTATLGCATTQRQMLCPLHPFALQRAQTVYPPGHAALLDDAAPPTLVVADREQVPGLLPEGGSPATLSRGRD